MTSRPRAVQQASERADQLHQEAYPEGQREPSESGGPGVSDGTPDQESGAPPAGEVPNQGQEAPSQPPAAAAPPPPAPAREETVDFWRSKFQTLEGKYRAEVPRLQSQLRESSDRLQRMEQTLAAMSTAQAPSTPPQQGGNKLVTEEEVEEYGDDFVSLVRRVAQEEAGRAVQQVTPKIEKVEGEIERTRTQSAIDRVYAQLDDHVKNWRAINRSPEYLAWLDEEDPFSGTTRKTLLRAAFDRADGPLVLRFFTGFLNEQQALNPQPQPAEPQTPPARTQPRVSLEQLAGPRGGNGGGGATVPDEGSIQPWTRRQIAAFYKDAQLGHYKTDPAKYKAIEASIHRAVAAGLVTP